MSAAATQSMHIGCFSPSVSGGSLLGLEKVLRRWFYNPDLQAIRIVLGTIKTHYLNIGDPAWLFVVAPPGAGKSTMSIVGAAGLPNVISLGDFTENTFLSGFYGHQTPGMLEKLGHTTQNGNTFTTTGDGIFLAKDFTTVLTMRRDKRGAVLAQLREIHDGQFKRDFGTGQSKIWNGRVTIVAAVTPALDRHYSVFSTLGERFLQVRWHRPDSEQAGEWAIRQQGQEERIRQDLREAIGEAFRNSAQNAPVLSSSMEHRIARLAEITAIGRTHIYRASFGNREIEYVPEAEANTRVSKGLAAIAKGIAALSQHSQVEEQDLQDAMRVGMDCLPENRRKLLIAAVQGCDPYSLSIFRTVCDRELENLEALDLLEQQGETWKLTANADRLWSSAGVVVP
jgi:hypothetical protein